MAEHCNFCNQNLYGYESHPDINVFEIFESLEENESYTVLCAGCNMRLVANISGSMKVGYYGKIGWFEYEDRFKTHKF